VPGHFDLAFTGSAGGPTATSGLALTATALASEPSVAVAGNVMMYTANRLGPPLVVGTNLFWQTAGAALSTNGGSTFTLLDPNVIFPAPSYFTAGVNQNSCYKECDQVVIYDRYAGVFVWVIQYAPDLKKHDMERIAWASPAALAAKGAGAWTHYTDLYSQGLSNTQILDQPRLGLTPGFLYISFNLPTGTIFRIKHSAFKYNSFSVSPSQPLSSHTSDRTARAAGIAPPVELITGSTDELRVAQDVTGTREYFVGLRGGYSSALVVASVADDENVLDEGLVNTWARADSNGPGAWPSKLPDGSDWLARQANAELGNVTGVTMDGDGNVWAAWSESRDVLSPDHKQVIDPNTGRVLCTLNAQKVCPTPARPPGLPPAVPPHSYPNSHIGFVRFIPHRITSSSTSGPLKIVATLISYDVATEGELWNPTYALAMPDLATDASGEVAMGFYAGGGPYYVTHGVGFLTPTGTDLVTDAKSSAMTADTSNDYGDYQTVRPLPAPYGNCLVSATAVTGPDTALSGLTIPGLNHPVISFFSRPGQRCPRVLTTRPPPNLPIGKSRTTLGLGSTDAGTSYSTGATAHLEADLAPHELGDTVTFEFTSPSGAHTSFTNTVDQLGRARSQLTLNETGLWTVQADFGGSNDLAGSSSNTLTLTVGQAATTSTTAVACPGSTLGAGATAAIAGTVTPGVQGTPVSVSYTPPTGTGGTQTTDQVTTDGTGGFNDAFAPNAPGQWTVTASFTGDVRRTGSQGTCSFSVSPPQGVSSLSMNCPSTASPGNSLTLTATLAPALQNASIAWTATAPDGSIQSQTVLTDATATAYYNLTVGIPGTWTITAQWAGDATHTPSSGSCTIAVLAPTSTTVTCPATALQPLTPASITGTVSPAVNGTPVSISYSPPPGSGGTPGTDNVTTDGAGNFADTYAQDAAGTWDVTATYAGDTTHAPSTASCTFDVLLG